MNKIALPRILSHLFSALLTLTLTFVLLASTLAATMFNKGYLKFTLERSHYAQNLCDDIVTKLKTLSAASGVEESFFESAVNVETVKTDAYGFVKAAISGEGISAYKTEVETRFEGELFEKLKVYAKDQGFELSQSVEEALSHLASVGAGYYANFTAGSIMGALFAALGAVSDKLLLPLIIGIAVLLLVAVIAFINAYKLDKTNIIKSLIGTGLSLSILPILTVATRFISRLGVAGKGITAFMSGYIGTVAIVLAIEAALVLIAAAAIYFLNKKQV